ncbi:hypothetical protein MASR1M101_16110 [Gemmatimonas sp.]
MLNSTIGNAPTLATSPTTNAELESSSASHPTAIVCIHEPMAQRLPRPENPIELREWELREWELREWELRELRKLEWRKLE